MQIDVYLWIWLILAISITAAFLKINKASSILLFMVILCGMFYGVVTPIGLMIIGTFFTALYYLRDKNWLPPTILSAVVVVFCVFLFLHLIPGFNNPQVLEKVQAGPLSADFNMYINLDKPLVFFALLCIFPHLLGTPRKPNYRTLFIVCTLLFSLLPIASVLGAIKPELTIPSWWWLFAFNNLMFTSVSEEALFRGFIQQKLTDKFGLYIALVITSFLFGAAHFAGGPLLIIFASLAGLCYGLVFHLTGRLWAAVLIHFLFNFSHLIFYTYPMLRG
ncbi:CPBP family intramembrane glutamic endopeptidase [Vibrio zhanjiangensis]|uniref:CPBP family intramembrane glutamic endopeptidase n=1 Tax=Vibrio zhanjiangensis TaxID=1046128 RepID=UPI0024E0CE64|nr:CPBP family intramembrane glutamic endopeptidase [Vibrio zhanjiangensis]